MELFRSRVYRLPLSAAGLLALSLLLLQACAGEEPVGSKQSFVEGDGTLQVYAVNAPLAWLAAEIGGDQVSVTMPVPAGTDPAFWQPVAEEILPWQSADLILLNGAGYAAWIDYASLPRARLVDTSASLGGYLLPREVGLPHSHGPDGTHSQGPQAFTIWLDMRLLAKQAEAIVAALERELPEQSMTLRGRYNALKAQLEDWDEQLAVAATSLAGRTVIYSHPVYQYFARRYQLPGSSVHWEPDLEPSTEQWLRLEALLEQSTRPLMIWEAEPLPAVRRQLQEMGVELVVFAPGGGASTVEYKAVVKANLERLVH